MVIADGWAGGSTAAVPGGLVRRKWATARGWRPLLASEADWLVACLLNLFGRRRWARLLPPLSLRLAADPQPLHLRPGTSDFATFREIFLDSEYDLVHRFAAPPCGVLDLGANVGFAARWLRMQFPRLRVLCVEPDGRNAALAARNLAADVAAGAVQVVQAFAGGSPREAWLDAPGRGLVNESRLSDRAGSGPGIPVHTVGEWLDRCPFPVDTVKMDVEGSEREIFERDPSWLAAVRDVLVEVHAPLDEHWLRGVLPPGGPARVRAVLHRHPGAFLAWVTCRE